MVATRLLVLILVVCAATQQTAREKLQTILDKLKLTENEQKELDAAQNEYSKRFQTCLDQQCVSIQDAILQLQRQRAKVEEFTHLGNRYMNCTEACQKKDRYLLREVEKLLERSEVYSDLLEMQSTDEIDAALEYWDKVKSDVAL